MGFFNWAAPLFRRADRRWTAEDVRVIADHLRPAVGPEGSLLDVGGGTGALATLLAAELQAHATILDATPEMLRYVRESESVTAVLGEAQDMPFPDNAFDALVVTDAFHHMRDQHGAVAEFARVTKPEGRVLVLEHDRSARGMSLVIWGERLLGEPATFLTPAEMTSLMTEHGIVGESTRERGPSYRFLGERTRRP